MTLNKLQLPGFVISNLYKNSLIETDIVFQDAKNELTKKIETTELKNSGNIKFLGNNNKKIVIMLQDAENVFVADHHLQFLTNILKACFLTIEDVAIVNTHKQKLNYKNFQDQLPSHYFILFGINTLDIELPFTIPMYQNQQYNQNQFLIAPSLNQLNNESQEARIEKSKLWTSLKNMFNLK
jgi:hypothetical protein